MSQATQAPQVRAEILKLARILEREPDTLAYLEAVPLADLRRLRDQTTEVLWSANRTTYSRLAAASRLLPPALSATITERAFGALITARLAGALEPERAIAVAAKLSTPFVADVAIELDPRRATAVIAGIPPQRIGEITRELVGRGEYVTLGRFVGHISDEALAAAVGAMSDSELLRVGFVLEDKDRLERLISSLPTERIEGLASAAAQDELWLEALDLLSHLSPPCQRRIVSGASELDEAALESLVAAVTEHELWDEAQLIAEHDQTVQDRLSAAFADR